MEAMHQMNQRGTGGGVPAKRMTRRDFLKLSLLTGAAFAVRPHLAYGEVPGDAPSTPFKPDSAKLSDVYVIKTVDREQGITELLKRYDLSGYTGKRIAIKANFNSADAFPASTHLDGIRAFLKSLAPVGPSKVVLAERSGMGGTRSVMSSLGVFDFATTAGIQPVVLDELGEQDWVKFQPAGSHWQNGFLLAKPFADADKIVQFCCLKTHRFGGHFTMSLKNSVGMVAKVDPVSAHNYMRDLHRSPYQRHMIAEINQAYTPDLIIMDALKAITTGGPDKGTLVEPGVMIAGTDRVAVDAVGVALLRMYGTTPEVSRRKIFEQDQIARAVELGIGTRSAEDIRLLPADDATQSVVAGIEEQLKAG